VLRLNPAIWEAIAATGICDSAGRLIRFLGDDFYFAL
jgi:hypothetical protein